jgi:hypothetical protein
LLTRCAVPSATRRLPEHGGLTRVNETGYPLLNLEGMLSSNFVVQYSTNLAATNWVNLLSLSNLSATPYQFLDPAGVVSPARFYRAYMQ